MDITDRFYIFFTHRKLYKRILLIRNLKEVLMPYLKTRVLELYYEISGQGEPIVFIGGLTSTVLSWKYQQKELQKYHQVVLFDNRGSGRTRILKPQQLSMQLFANDVYDLLKGLGIKKAHILGASMGGMIAQIFAHSYPECCISLILCCTACGLETGVKAQPEIVQIRCFLISSGSRRIHLKTDQIRYDTVG